MPICKICHKPVTSGVVVHSECYEELNNFDNTQSKLLLIKISELRKENAELKRKLKPTEPNCIYEDEAICPYCSEILDLTDDNPVCRECGQVIDWWEW